MGKGGRDTGREGLSVGDESRGKRFGVRQGGKREVRDVGPGRRIQMKIRQWSARGSAL